MKKSTRISLIVVIVLFVAGMALYPTIRNYYSSDKGKDAQAPPRGNPGPGGRGGGGGDRALNINAQILKHGTLTGVIPNIIGRLIPDEEVDLSFETSGKITNIYFKEGTFVKKGDLLAKINDSPLQAELKKLQAQIPLAEDRVFRQKSLLEKDAVSKEAYEQVATELEKLNADIQLVNARISQTELRAPFDGEIGLRQVSEGTYASPSTMVATLTKTIPLKIEFSINEIYAKDVVPGTTIIFKIKDDLSTYKASVYAVESKLEKKMLTLKARATYPNPNGHLKPGQATDIIVHTTEIKDALMIPSEAIIAEMGRDIAFIYKDGKAHQVELEKGTRTESVVQILRGVSPGDTLITTGVMQLRDGLPVKIDNIIE